MLLLVVIEIVLVVVVLGVHSLLVALLFSGIDEQEKEGQSRYEESTEVVEYWRTSHENVEVAY